MATIKSYTDVPQSKNLAKILSIDSADMYYPYDLDSRKILNIPVVKDDYCMPCIHCWSLAALLEVTSKAIVMNKVEGNSKYIFSSSYIGTYTTAQNPIDACVEMIEKLHELNLL